MAPAVVGPPDQFLGVDQQALGARRDLFANGVSITWRWLRSTTSRPAVPRAPDPSAQRRLRDRTTFRSTAEMALLGQRAQKAELLKTGRITIGMSNEAVRFYPLDQWPGMADLPQTRDTTGR